MSYLKYIRIKSGKTQKQFANSLGVSQATISKMEGFILPIGFDELKRLHMSYKVNLNKAFELDFFNGVELMFETWRDLDKRSLKSIKKQRNIILIDKIYNALGDN